MDRLLGFRWGSAMCADGEADCGDPDRLVELTEEIGRIARGIAGCDGPRHRTLEVTAPVIRSMIRARRIRDSFFDPELFGEPAWDIMLDLLASRLEGKIVSVSSVCMAAGVSQSTAMRWVMRLTNCGLLIRKADPKDGRRTNLELSDEAVAHMTDCIVSGHGASDFLM